MSNFNRKLQRQAMKNFKIKGTHTKPEQPRLLAADRKAERKNATGNFYVPIETKTSRTDKDGNTIMKSYTSYKPYYKQTNKQNTQSANIFAPLLNNLFKKLNLVT